MSEKRETCWYCEGSGYVTIHNRWRSLKKCPICDGEGVTQPPAPTAATNTGSEE